MLPRLRNIPHRSSGSTETMAKVAARIWGFLRLKTLGRLTRRIRGGREVEIVARAELMKKDGCKRQTFRASCYVLCIVIYGIRRASLNSRRQALASPLAIGFWVEHTNTSGNNGSRGSLVQTRALRFALLCRAARWCGAVADSACYLFARYTYQLSLASVDYWG